MSAGVEYHWVKTESGERLRAWRAGPAEGEPVLLIAGGGSDGHSWRFLVSELFDLGDPLAQLAADPSLATDHRVVGYDQRSTGASSGAVPPDSSRLAAEHAAEVGRALLGERFHAVGLSLGGMAAQRLALDHPDLVASLVLMATSAGGPGLTVPDPAFLANITGAGATEPRARAEENLALAFGAGFATENAELFARMVDEILARPASDDGWVAQAQTFATHDTTSELERLRVPTLVVVGDEDRVMPPANSVYLAEHIASSILVRIEAAGHAIDIQSADQVVRHISSHVSAQPLLDRET